MKKNYSAFVLLTTILMTPLSLSAAPATITADPYKDTVSHRISLYLWGSGMKGDMGNAAGSASS